MRSNIMCRACVGSIFDNILRPETGPTQQQFIATSALAAAAALAQQALAGSGGAEVIFRGGTIRPMSGQDGVIEALAIGGGKGKFAAGTDADVMALKNTNTRIVELDGRAVLPGLIDPHHHTSFAALAAALFFDVGFVKYRTRADLFADAECSRSHVEKQRRRQGRGSRIDQSPQHCAAVDSTIRVLFQCHDIGVGPAAKGPCRRRSPTFDHPVLTGHGRDGAAGKSASAAGRPRRPGRRRRCRQRRRGNELQPSRAGLRTRSILKNTANTGTAHDVTPHLMSDRYAI